MSRRPADPSVSGRILDAADRLLARHGFRHMTVDAIAAEAGIGKGSVYLHFSTKEDVALSCLDRMADRIHARLRAIAAGAAPLRRRVREILRERVLARFDYARAHADSIDEMLAAMRPAMLARRRQHFAREAAVLAGLLEARGGLPREPAARVADALVLATNSLLPYSLSVRELGRRPEIERRLEALLDVLVAGLPAAGPRRSPVPSPTRRSAVKHAATALVLATLLALAGPARAQFAPGSPSDPDTPIDAATRAAVVESLAVDVQEHYVFPDKGAALARNLRHRLAAHEYDRITSSREFADSLLAHMQALTHDLHMRAGYRYEPLPLRQRDSLPEAERRREHELERARNFGFERVQRLAGNVGYLDLRSFSGDPDAQATAIAAMNFLGNVDAIIFDLRRNGGGDPNMIQTLLTYLVSPGQRLHINDFYQREGDRYEQFWTSPSVPGPRLAGRPVYVLTSPLTGSAAEEFSYDVQTHRLGTLYGATTAGAANPGGAFRLSDHLYAFIATGRAVNPETHTNWEGVGVKPDHDVPPGEALREAHVAAIQALLDAATDPASKERLGLALEQARQTPADPADDFVRGKRRMVVASH